MHIALFVLTFQETSLFFDFDILKLLNNLEHSSSCKYNHVKANLRCKNMTLQTVRET